MGDMRRLTEATGRMLAYKSRCFRKATIGDEYPSTLLEGELITSFQLASSEQLAKEA